MNTTAATEIDAIAPAASAGPSSPPALRTSAATGAVSGKKVSAWEADFADHAPGGGESLLTFQERVAQEVQALAAQNIGKQLKTDYSADHAAVGFGGRTGFVASVHQEGKSIRPSKNAKSTRYPVRELVGFSKDDQEWIKSEITKFLTL